jgi:hypothetical protein
MRRLAGALEWHFAADGRLIVTIGGQVAMG